MIRYKPIYPETSLGLETNQFSKLTRTRTFSSNQSHNNKPTQWTRTIRSFWHQSFLSEEEKLRRVWSQTYLHLYSSLLCCL